MQDEDKHRQAFEGVLRRAQAEAAYRAALMADPAGTLAAAGLPLPPGIRISVSEPQPGGPLQFSATRADGEVEDGALDVSAGGSDLHYFWPMPRFPLDDR